MSAAVLGYERLGGDLHRHGDAPAHSHPHDGPHVHPHGGHEHIHPHGGHEHGHGHTHGLVDPSIKRSRAGLRAVGLALAVLGATALAQLAIFALTGSVALLADLVHNFGDAATAIPLAIAFLLRSERAEGVAGMLVVAAIFFSACVAGYEAIARLLHPQAPTDLAVLAAAGFIGFSGNLLVARIRTRADAWVSLAVVVSAGFVAVGLQLADPLIGLAISAVILKITWDSWLTVRGRDHRH